MSEQIINISFPVNAVVLASLKETKDDFTRDVLFLSSLLFYRKRKLSLGKAGELAGYSKVEFIEEMQDEEEYIFDYTDEELDEMVTDAGKYPKGARRCGTRQNPISR